MGKDMKTDNGIKWTDQQAHVIDTRHGNLLVSAAAGSGKTAVLVERIIEMVAGRNSRGDRIEGSEPVSVDEASCRYIYKCGSGPDEGEDRTGTAEKDR